MTVSIRSSWVRPRRVEHRPNAHRNPLRNRLLRATPTIWDVCHLSGTVAQAGEVERRRGGDGDRLLEGDAHGAAFAVKRLGAAPPGRG